jgi:glycolate oxidase FAD binding subunit
MAPRTVVRPGDAGQVAATLRVCAEAGAAVIPWGGGTAIEVGNLPRAADVVLLTERLAGVVEHDDSNLTVTVQAGITLAALDRTLAARRQFLPLEPPRAEAATAGGAVAVNLNGPRRMRYGSVRDFVLGTRLAQTAGAVTKSGGKTVKNVAGYDMGRLFVGSLGTLGVITEVTFKVSPLPETTRTIAVWASDSAWLVALAGRIFESPLIPSSVILVNRAAAERLGRGLAGLLVRVEGVEAAVARHERDVNGWASGSSQVETLTGDQEALLWRTLRDFGWGDPGVAIRMSVPPGRTPALIEALGAGLPEASRTMADLGTGTLWTALRGGDEAAAALPGIDAALARLDGNLLITRAPRSLKASRDVWAPAPAAPALEVMRALKRSFDPHGVLNPGRFVAGL